MRADRADAHQDTVVSQQGKEQLQRRTFLFREQRRAQRPLRVAVREAELVGDRSEVAFEREP